MRENNVYDFHQGNLPIFISMPHNGVEIPPDIAQTMTESALNVVDTDWYMDKVYEFAVAMGCSVLTPKYSRYVIDLNRPPNDESLYPGADTTELCPTTQFNYEDIYVSGKKPNQAEIKRRVDTYWQPYHQKIQSCLKDMQQHFSSVLLFEAHSIKSEVPRFFQGKLPDFNFGTYNEKSCSEKLTKLVKRWQPQGYTKVVNERFKGGYITRAYAAPESGVDTLQLELSQATYLNEHDLSYAPNNAQNVIKEIQTFFNQLISLYSTN